jgi:hypothetical protein
MDLIEDKAPAATQRCSEAMMSRKREGWPSRFTLIVTVMLLVFGSVVHAKELLSEQPAQPQLETFLPDGYQVDKFLRHDFDNKGYRQYVVAISNHINSEQSLMLLFLEHNGTWFVKDKAQIHPAASQDSGTMFDQPNYFDGMALSKVDTQTLILFESVASFGGSGASFFFDFYQIHNGRLVLVKTFNHARMEQTYFCIFNGAVYDAVLVNIKGKKVGKSFVHTYYLDVTKFTFDGVNFVALGHERMREKQGNWTMADSYRFISVYKAVQSGEIFAQPH